MTFDEFAASYTRHAPPPELSPPLEALWWAAHGDWEKAHALIQDAPGARAAWVHAHLHRVEGDDSNAAYWYRRAGRAAASCEPAAERRKIAEMLLQAESCIRDNGAAPP